MTHNDEYSIARYILKQIISNPGCGALANSVLNWAEEHSDNLLDMDLEEYWDISNRRLSTRRRNIKLPSDCESDEDGADKTEKPARNLKTLQVLISQCGYPDIFANGFDTGIDAMMRTFRLSRVGGRLFTVLAFIEKYPIVASLFSDLVNQRFLHDISVKNADLLAMICGVRRTDLLRVLAPDGELFQTGLVRVSSNGSIELYGCIRSMIIRNAKTTTQIKRDLMGAPLHSELTAHDFEHIAYDYDYVSTLLRCALEQRRGGINILLYGEPGTGKTEFAKSVCDTIGADLYNLDQANGDRESRLSTLIRGSRLTRNNKNTVLLLDEAEDIFSSYEKRTSKLNLNQVLESNITPTIWISNSVEDMDPAFLRRFQYITEIKKPGEAARRDMWHKICDRYKLYLSDEQIEEYVRQYDIAPSMIDSAVAGVVLTGKSDSLTRTLDNMQIAITGTNPAKQNSGSRFLPQLLNTDTNLETLADKLVARNARRFSLCLYGASGTGKSAYAVYLAKRLGIKCIHHRASDLMGKYVGETEKNIAKAFRDAANEHAMLVFDEADSFLQNRDGAQRSWEVSAVNEMLTQMESYEYPFICTTNLMAKIDPASLRRFSFKVKYDFLTPDQVSVAFKHFFDQDLTCTPGNLTKLAPGDFVVVRTKCDILGIRDTDEILQMLDKEQQIKSCNGHHNKIGF